MARRLPDVGPWPGESVPRGQWSIASSETLTPDEEANLAILNRWNDIQYNRSNDFEAITELITDPLVVHGPGGTQTRPPEELVQPLATLHGRYPGYEGSSDDLFVVGDRAVKRFCYRFPEPHPDHGSLHCGIVLYRFEDHRIAEYWSIYLPIDVDWS